MAFLDLFSDEADRYAAARPRYPAELISFVAAKSDRHRLAWDCGTGNGQAAVALASTFGEVFASDPSAEQIANALAAPGVRYVVEPAERSSLPDHCVDAICVAQALHWFVFDEFFDEVKRVAADGAFFCAWGYSWFNVESGFDREFQASLLDVVRPFWAKQNKLLWDGYRDVPLPFARSESPTFQIVEDWNFFQLLAYVRTWSAVRRCIADQGQEFLVVGAERLQRLWGPPERSRPVSMPVSTLAGYVS